MHTDVDSQVIEEICKTDTHPASNGIFGGCTDNGGNIDGKDAVPKEAHCLEETNVAPQQDDIERQYHCSHRQSPKHKLQLPQSPVQHNRACCR